MEAPGTDSRGPALLPSYELSWVSPIPPEGPHKWPSSAPSVLGTSAPLVSTNLNPSQKKNERIPSRINLHTLLQKNECNPIDPKIPTMVSGQMYRFERCLNALELIVRVFGNSDAK